jgi:hypothetical protein
MACNKDASAGADVRDRGAGTDFEDLDKFRGIGRVSCRLVLIRDQQSNAGDEQRSNETTEEAEDSVIVDSNR